METDNSMQSLAIVRAEEEVLTPASPASQYLYSEVISLRMLCILESEIPIDDSETFKVMRELLLPINPRFSSILVTDGKGRHNWKRVDMNLEDHVRVPSFPEGLSPAEYDRYWYDYLAEIAMESFPERRPPWEAHLFKYPLSTAAGAITLRLHHELGDGFSLMGALFHTFKRADDPSLPLTFPPTAAIRLEDKGKSGWKKAVGMVGGCWNTTEDVVKSVLHSTVMQDDLSAIRSGKPQLEYLPTQFSAVVLSLDRIKEVKSQVARTVNDVVTGMLFYGIHLYNRKMGQNSRRKRMTAIVLLNTRMVRGYQSIEDMLEKKTWGNHFTFLQVPIPPCDDVDKEGPLKFILQAQKTIKRQRNSMGFFIIGRLLSLLRRIKGPKAVSRYIYGTLNNNSVGISNVIGPVEQAEVAGHPLNNIYYYIAGAPQSVATAVVSYMGKLTMTVCAEKDFVDPDVFTSCVNEAFEKIYDMACGKGRTKHK